MATMTITPEPVIPIRQVVGSAERATRRRAGDASGLRLTARGRGVVLVLALLVAAAFGSIAQHAAAGAPPQAVPVSAWTVAPGETLWQIAGVVAEPGEDLRVVVAELIELNGLAGASLQAGQQILVPRS